MTDECQGTIHQEESGEVTLETTPNQCETCPEEDCAGKTQAEGINAPLNAWNLLHKEAFEEALTTENPQAFLCIVVNAKGIRELGYISPSMKAKALTQILWDSQLKDLKAIVPTPEEIQTMAKDILSTLIKAL